MLPELTERMTVVEVELRTLKQTIVEEKQETREHREKLQDKVDTLVRLVFIGVGILITLQFVAPIILGALKLGK